MWQECVLHFWQFDHGDFGGVHLRTLNELWARAGYMCVGTAIGLPAANLGALGTIFGSLRDGVAPFGLFRGCPRVFGPFLDVGPCRYSPGDVLGCKCCFGQSGIDPQPFGSHSRGHFGVILGWFWCHLDHLRTLKCHVGLCWGHLGVVLGSFGGFLEANCVHFEANWGRFSSF